MALSSSVGRLFRRWFGQYDGQELIDLLDSEVAVLNTSYTSSALPKSSVDVGTASGTGVVATEYGNGVVHKTVLTLTAAQIPTTDATTAGASGGLKVYTFPEGVIQVLGASYNLTTARVSTGLATTAAMVGSLGTVSALTEGDATLTSTEADIIASTTGTLTAGAGSFKKHGSINTTAFDGHTTPVPVWLNTAVVDAGTSANDALACTGTITLSWVNLGDY